MVGRLGALGVVGRDEAVEVIGKALGVLHPALVEEADELLAAVVIDGAAGGRGFLQEVGKLGQHRVAAFASIGSVDLAQVGQLHHHTNGIVRQDAAAVVPDEQIAGGAVGHIQRLLGEEQVFHKVLDTAQQDGTADAQDEENGNAQQDVQLDVDLLADCGAGQNAQIDRAAVFVVLLHGEGKGLVQGVQPTLQGGDLLLHSLVGEGLVLIGDIGRVRSPLEHVDDILAVGGVDDVVGLAVQDRYVVADEVVIDGGAVYIGVILIDIAQYEAAGVVIGAGPGPSLVVEGAVLVFVAVALDDFQHGGDLFAVHIAVHDVGVVALLVFFEQDFPVLGQLAAQDLGEEIRDLHIADVVVFVEQVRERQAGGGGNELRVGSLTVAEVFRDLGNGIVQDLRLLDVIVTLPVQRGGIVGDGGVIHVFFTKVGKVAAQDLIQHGADVFGAVFAADRELDDVLGGVVFLHILAFVDLGLLRFGHIIGHDAGDGAAGTDGVHVDGQAQILNGLLDDGGREDLRNIQILAAGGLAVLGLGVVVFDDGLRRIGLVAGSVAHEEHTRTERHQRDERPPFFQISDDVKTFHFVLSLSRMTLLLTRTQAQSAQKAAPSARMTHLRLSSSARERSSKLMVR